MSKDKYFYAWLITEPIQLGNNPSALKYIKSKGILFGGISKGGINSHRSYDIFLVERCIALYDCPHRKFGPARIGLFGEKEDLEKLLENIVTKGARGTSIEYHKGIISPFHPTCF